MYEIPLALQTSYADLVDRTFTDAFAADFPENGTFVSKARNGRRYWYFQSNEVKGRPQKYVGPETPDLIERIEKHNQSHGDVKQRRTIVASLHRAVSLPRPTDQVGTILEALSRAGVFRLRAVLVGTFAYQTYAAMLGVRLPSGAVLSQDIDIAQFGNVSIAVEEKVPSMLNVLREADDSFRDIPHSHDTRLTTRYEAKSGLRVDFLTPNRGPDSDEPKHLPALDTYAEQLRFLDYLIAEPVRAVVLHGAGIPVFVPSPQRYAVHKLIVARRRNSGNTAKIEKDLWQAASLFEILSARRPHDLRDAWNEAWSRGKRWRQHVIEGLSQISPDARDITLKTVGEARGVIPGLALTFPGGRPHYDFDRDVVAFRAEIAGKLVPCAVSREALEDDFGADHETGDRHMAAFRQHRATIEQLAAGKYLWGAVEKEVLVKTGDLANPVFGIPKPATNV
jgi:hypothetical protein